MEIARLTQPKQQRMPMLTREDWIDQAIEVLVESGIDAVQITDLARRMNITRGSFYWHFENRDDLLDAITKEWQQRNTGVMVDALRIATTLDEGLLALFEVWVDKKLFDPELDQSMREWSRRSESLGKKVQKEDNSRVGAIAGFLEQHGYQHPESFVRARVIYFTQLSYYALDVRELMSDRISYLNAYFQCFIGRAADPGAAEAFIALHKDKIS